ncbi:MAG: DUF4493 domain-containing protein [Muribaculaceae bacterium]
MKNNLISILTLTGAIAFLGSCSESVDYPVTNTGQLALSSLGVEVDNAERVMGDNSRYTVDLNPFIVTIYDDQDQKVEQWTYGTMPEIFSLPVGHYRVDVKSHEVAKAAWDEPLFEGSQEFDIVNNEITEVNRVICKFASLKVTVNFNDDLRAVMGDDVKVVVEANDEGRLEFTPNETRAGYFAIVPGSTTMIATFTGTVKGYSEYICKTYTDIEAGQHRILNFTIKNNNVEPEEEVGYIDPSTGINIDMSVTNEDLSGNANVGDEETLNPDDRPGSNEVFSEKVTIEYNENAKTLTVTAPDALSVLTLGIDSDNSDLVAALTDINGVNLANPGTAASAVATWGLPAASAVDGATSVVVDLTKIFEKCAEFTGTHGITLSGTDTKGQSSTYRVVAPGQVVESAITFDSVLQFDTPMPAADQTDGRVLITAPNGIAHLIIRINSTNIDFANTTATLSGADLAYPGDLASTFDSFGLANGDAVLNQTEVNFDITSFFVLLGGFPGTHTFTIDVTDNQNNNEVRNIILTVPE